MHGKESVLLVWTMVAEHLLDTENCSWPWTDPCASRLGSEYNSQENLKCTARNYRLFRMLVPRLDNEVLFKEDGDMRR